MKRAINACAEGVAPASLAATPIRQSTSCMKFVASPERPVIALHTASEPASTQRGFQRSAASASGSEAKE